MRYAININDELVLLKPQHLDTMKHQRNIIKEGMWTEAELNAIGIYQITDGTFDPFALTKIGFTLELVDNKAIETITTEDIPLSEIQDREAGTVESIYDETTMRPEVDTTLGFSVLGGAIDLLIYDQRASRIENGDIEEVTDIDGVDHGITRIEMGLIATKIYEKAKTLGTIKRNKRKAIKAAKNVQEVRDAIK
jgi:hypothetical protein